MDTKTAEALEGSIEKWEKIRDGKGRDDGSSNCPLCEALEGCEGCPVMLKTGKKNCVESPYENWIKHHARVHKDKVHCVVICSHCETFAQQEVDFLISLREPEEKKIEPQAGDVWRIYNNGYAYIYEAADGQLKYRFGNKLDEGVYNLKAVMGGATRIFSLTEYLKGKEEEGK